MKAFLYAATFAVLVSNPVLSPGGSVSLSAPGLASRDRIAGRRTASAALRTLVINHEQTGPYICWSLRRLHTRPGDEE